MRRATSLYTREAHREFSHLVWYPHRASDFDEKSHKNRRHARRFLYLRAPRIRTTNEVRRTCYGVPENRKIFGVYRCECTALTKTMKIVKFSSRASEAKRYNRPKCKAFCVESVSDYVLSKRFIRNFNEKGDFRDAEILRTSSLFTLHFSLFIPPSPRNSYVAKKNGRSVKPPLCKGRWHGVRRDGGIVVE